MIVKGARGRIEDVEGFVRKVREISTGMGIEIQVVDADLVCGKDHVISAVMHAVRSFKEKRNSTRSLSMELLLYLSGERQISRAIEKVGIKEGKERHVFVFLGSDDLDYIEKSLTEDEAEGIIRSLGMELDDGVMRVSREKLERFGLTMEEIETVDKDKYGDLILEKVALVDLMK
ncbi:MAG TPA: hypothetical protein ENG60_02355 [Thermoplasmatales archaeon]|nr:hypothetical protein [Thermoplasmatales archaeon]HEX17238.1 hypothetical protein [Thermoplasmatales archaeon]